MNRAARRQQARGTGRREPGDAALYHVVYATEGYEQSAKILINLVRKSQQTLPNGRRLLYLDVDEHRTPAGDLDAEMCRLRDFIANTLRPYLTRVKCSVLFPAGELTTDAQNNVIPAEIPL